MDNQENQHMGSRTTPYYFLPALFGLCLLYLLFEFFFDAYSMITVDEFWFAHRIYQFKTGMPYRDFAPYKTVLGYYLLLLPMLSAQGVIGTLVFTKNFIAILNASLFLGSAWWFRRFFTPTAIIGSLALLLTSDIVLTFSTHIRVDLLGYWCCFISLLCLLNNRYRLAGILLGVGFLVTQKSLWYIFATETSLLLFWFLFARNRTLLMEIMHLNFYVVLTIIAYIVCWGVLVNWQTVSHSVFFEASALYQLTWYDNARKLFWGYTLLYNPCLFLMAPLTLISLAVTYPNDTHYQRRFIIIIYALTILVSLIPYKQVFPYYMQVTIPIYFILYAAFFSWLMPLFKQEHLLFKLSKGYLWCLLSIYLLGVIALLTSFQLPNAYALVCLIGILLMTYLEYQKNFNGSTVILFQRLILISLFFTGILYPCTLIVIKTLNVNGAYQKANLEVIRTILKNDSDYIAGIELFYNKTQPIPGLRHLMGPAIEYLAAPTPELKTVMLASLYEDPNATEETVIAALKQTSVKLYVNNYRMMALPKNIKHYLDSQYEHFWGSIYLYAPRLSPGLTPVAIKFSGRYLVDVKPNHQIMLNGVSLLANSLIYLKKGTYVSLSKVEYRLKYMPETTVSLNPIFRKDEFNKIIF